MAGAGRTRRATRTGEEGSRKKEKEGAGKRKKEKKGKEKWKIFVLHNHYLCNFVFCNIKLSKML